METHRVDLVCVDNFRRSRACLGAFRGTRPEPNRFRWRAVPGSGRTASRTRRAVSFVNPARVVLARVEMAGLGSRPNSVATRAAVPDLEARPFGTRPSRPGATQPAVVPFPPPTATHTPKISETGS
jgi:hypothetical protein